MNDMYNDPRTLTERWMMAKYDGLDLSSRADMQVDDVGYLRTVWPFLNEYHSPHNPVFSPIFRRFLREMREDETAWFRDGIIPLSWFLREHAPQNIRGHLVVSERLAPYVPIEWRSRFSFYRLRTPEFANPAKLIIAGPVNESVCSLNELEALLDRAMKRLGRNKPEVQLFAPFRSMNDTYPAEYIRRIFACFPKAVTIDWHYIANLGTLKNTAYLEMNGDWIFSDSYVRHHMLSRGAGLLLDNAKGEATINLSRFHGAVIVPQSKIRSHAFDESLAKYCKQVADLSDQREDGLWPKWHESWCRGLA